MSECYIQDADPDRVHRCDDCGGMFALDDLDMIADIQERISPNGFVPSGQCPECQALTYELAEGETEELYCMPRIDINSLAVRQALVRHRDGYGEEAVEQAYKIASEEVGELLTAMNHHRRRRVGKEKVLEEVADVLLSCRLIADLLDGTLAVERVLDRKATRFQPGRGGLGQTVKLSDV